MSKIAYGNSSITHRACRRTAPEAPPALPRRLGRLLGCRDLRGHRVATVEGRRERHERDRGATAGVAEEVTHPALHVDDVAGSQRVALAVDVDHAVAPHDYHGEIVKAVIVRRLGVTHDREVMAHPGRAAEIDHRNRARARTSDERGQARGLP